MSGMCVYKHSARTLNLHSWCDSVSVTVCHCLSLYMCMYGCLKTQGCLRLYMVLVRNCAFLLLICVVLIQNIGVLLQNYVLYLKLCSLHPKLCGLAPKFSALVSKLFDMVLGLCFSMVQFCSQNACSCSKMPLSCAICSYCLFTTERTSMLWTATATLPSTLPAPTDTMWS